MYTNLGVHWTTSIPAFLALGCTPFPFLFNQIRTNCKYAAEVGQILESMSNSNAQKNPGDASNDDLEHEDKPLIINGVRGAKAEPQESKVGEV